MASTFKKEIPLSYNRKHLSSVVKSACRFHLLDEKEMHSCFLMAQVDSTGTGTDAAILRAIHKYSNRQDVQRISLSVPDDEDYQGLSIDAIEAQGVRNTPSSGVYDLETLFDRAAAAMRDHRLKKTFRNLLGRIVDGKADADDVLNWLPKIEKMRASGVLK